MLFKKLLKKINDPNYCYSWFLNRLAYYTKGSFGKPLSIIVLLTNRCNAHCVHCHSWKFQSSANEMTTEEWKTMFKKLRNWLGPIFISITGGEVLLKKNAIDIAEYAASLGFWVEFCTNGSLLNHEKVRQLIQSGVKRIKISLDGSQAEIHNKIRRRKGFFEKTTNALQMLKNEKDRKKQDIKIWGKTAIMSLNVKDLTNIVKLVQKLGIDGVEFQALEPVYYSTQQKNSLWYKGNPLWITDLAALSQNIQSLREMKIQGYPIINSIENLNMIEHYFYDPDGLAYKVHSHEYEKKNLKCKDWVRGLQIMPDGGMKMCFRMQPFASVKNGNIKKAWKNRIRCWKKPNLCYKTNQNVQKNKALDSD